MNIIFLDIDGVLNNQSTRERLRGGSIYALDPELVKIFANVLLNTAAKVVLSSSWRLSSDWKKDLIDAGLPQTIADRIIGITPHMPRPAGTGVEYAERGKEIEAWLADPANPKPEKFAILDDESDFLPDQPLFKTTWEKGITQEVAEAVIAHFWGQNDPAADGGVYEPVRRAICGPGPCTGEKLETYRHALWTMKLIHDKVAGRCYEYGRSEMQKIVKEKLTAAINTGRMKELGLQDVIVLDRTPAVELILNLDNEKKDA